VLRHDRITLLRNDARAHDEQDKKRDKMYGQLNKAVNVCAKIPLGILLKIRIDLTGI
jgi:hypothetical protein